MVGSRWAGKVAVRGEGSVEIGVGGEKKVVVGKGIILTVLECFQRVQAVVEGFQGIIQDAHIGIEIAGDIAAIPTVSSLVLMSIVTTVTTEKELAFILQTASARDQLSDLEQLARKIRESAQGADATAAEAGRVIPCW